jgi:selenocysteine-specific elongation factor SelB
VTTKNFILATAGHVDHGKSSLVKALTGTDPDRLPEEKARKITIELGFAHLTLNSPNQPEDSYSIGVIDVPGHEDFVKNMVAGVGSTDLALLIVAADDGWMAQTEEHLEILSYLGVRHAVVALTKIDLAQSEGPIEDEVRNHLRDSPFECAPIVRTSIMSGRGIDELKTELARQFAALEPTGEIGKPRLFVDRAFALRGIGTVVTGTVSGGEFVRGDTVVIQPGGDHSRIRSAQNHNREVERVAPGTRAAFNLSDVAVAGGQKSGVRRGDIVMRPGLGSADKAVDVFLLPPLRPNRPPPELRHGARVWVHHGSGNFAARLLFETSNKGDNSQAGPARLRFGEPVFFFSSDRLVLRDSSARVTLGGAIVLDPRASRVRFRSPAQRGFLARRADAPNDAAVFVLTQAIRDHAVMCCELLVQSRFSEKEIRAAVNSLAANGKLIVSGEFVFDPAWWVELHKRATALIDNEHTLHPEKPGIARSRLQSEFARDISRQEIFDALITDLCRNGFTREGEILRRTNHRPALPQALQTEMARIRDVLAAAKSDPPSRGALAPDVRSQQALHFLRESSEIVELNRDVLLAADHFASMRSAVIAFLKQHRSAAAGELRQMLGSSRRVVIPFLERLDHDGITRRVGDRRVLVNT